MPYSDKEYNKKYSVMYRERHRDRLRQYKKIYYETNKDILLKKQHDRYLKFREKNKERLSAEKRLSYVINKDRYKSYRRNYYMRERENVLSRNKKWRDKNKEYLRESRRPYLAQYREKNKLRLNEKSRRYKDEARELVFKHYGKLCACCGEDILSFLTIDHMNNDGNKHLQKSGIRFKGVRLYRWLINNNYPTGYQTLCWNCNCGKAKNNGVCPHKNLKEVS